MASSGNFMTFNRLAYQNSYSASYSKLDTGNLQGYATAGGWGWPSNFTFDSGKWYCEFYIYRRTGASIGYVAVVDHYYPHIDAKYNDNRHRGPSVADYTVYYIGSLDGSNAGIVNNDINYNASQTFSGIWQDGDIIGVALDLDSGTQTVQFYRNGSAVGNAETLNASASGSWAFWSGSHNACWHTMNAGQDSSFAGRATAQGNADENGFGDFYYTPPSGFLAPCSGNLPISDDIDPAQTDDDYNSKQFGVVSYTGNSTTGQTITGLGFQPDCIFAKMNSSSQRWFVTDTNRGITKHLFPNANSDEETDSGMGNTNPIYDAFNSDGFELGTSGSGPNDNNRVYTAMCWKGNGGTNSSNSEGSITCSTQANVKGGFSIITYTGTGSSATLGHGLEKAPETVLVKRRSGDQSWAVYHKSLGASQYFTLDSSGGAGSGSGMWNDTAPTSTLITIGSDSRVSLNNQTNVAYAWHGVEGYSKFSSYIGTGSTDGAFCFLGFRPHMIWTKRPGSGDWIIFTYADNSVNTSYVNGAFNPLNLRQKFTTEASASGKPIDFLSNGFKIRHTDSDTNLSGVEYPYWAWGDVPFKYNNTF